MNETGKAPFKWKTDSEILYDEIKDIKKQLLRIDQEFKERLDMIEEGIDDILIEKQRNDLSFDFSSMSEEDIAEFRQLSRDLLNFFLNGYFEIMRDRTDYNKDIRKQWFELIDRINTLKNKY